MFSGLPPKPDIPRGGPLSPLSKMQPAGRIASGPLVQEPSEAPIALISARLSAVMSEYPWRRMRRFRAASSGLDKFFAAQFSVGYITNMSGFDLRQAPRSDRAIATPAKLKMSNAKV